MARLKSVILLLVIFSLAGLALIIEPVNTAPVDFPSGDRDQYGQAEDSGEGDEIAIARITVALPGEEPAEEPEDEEGDKEEEEKAAAAKPSSPAGVLYSVYPLPASTIYTYEQMVKDLKSLQAAYPDLISLGSIGSSVEGRPLWSLTMGKGKKKVLLTGATHAREWLTTPLLVRTAETYAREYYRNGSVDGYPVRPVLDQYTLVFVPMQNPDGVILSQRGLAAVDPSRHEELLAMKPLRTDDFTRWKANIRGVDLNRQHSAGPNGWTMVRDLNPDNPRKPWYENYPGPAPESEPESRALANLIRQSSFELVLTYHSSGEYLFWYYFQDEYNVANYQRDLKIAQAISAYSGYGIHPREALHNRVRNFGAHLTAWAVHNLKIPCITVEIGRYTASYLKMADLPGIWQKTRALPLVAIRNLPSYRTSFNITLAKEPAAGGKVQGGGTFPYGTTITIIATPNPGYVFDCWKEGNKVVSKAAELQLTVTGDRSLTACFVETLELVLTASPEQGGELQGGGIYPRGSEVTVKAIPREGYRFKEWQENGATVSTEAEYTFILKASRSLIAIFEELPPPEKPGNGGNGGGDGGSGGES